MEDYFDATPKSKRKGQIIFSHPHLTSKECVYFEIFDQGPDLPQGSLRYDVIADAKLIYCTGDLEAAHRYIKILTGAGSLPLLLPDAYGDW